MSAVLAVTESVVGSAIAIGTGIAAAVGTGDVTGRWTVEGESIALVAEAGALSAVHTVMIGRETRIGVGAETAEDITTEGAVSHLVGAGAGIGKEGMTDDKNFQN